LPAPRTSDMQVQSNGISIEVDVRGAPQGEPLLLIMGLGMQLTGWHDRFVDVLVSRGYRVIRFDNRDAGLSQHFDALGMPNLPLAAARSALGLPLSRPYGLHDMAHDALGWKTWPVMPSGCSMPSVSGAPTCAAPPWAG
jgi:pimeloyl-ACP methyl ester carboxylesterase